MDYLSESGGRRRCVGDTNGATRANTFFRILARKQ
jgi:hypothetical protein